MQKMNICAIKTNYLNNFRQHYEEAHLLILSESEEVLTYSNLIRIISKILEESYLTFFILILKFISGVNRVPIQMLSSGIQISIIPFVIGINEEYSKF